MALDTIQLVVTVVEAIAKITVVIIVLLLLLLLRKTMTGEQHLSHQTPNIINNTPRQLEHEDQFCKVYHAVTRHQTKHD